jgi:HTH-type transcriptional regulator/antitoxin HigA
MNELRKRGFIRSPTSGVEQMRELLQFFRVATPEAWGGVWATPTAYRLSQSLDPNFAALATWIRIGELRVQEREPLPKYNREFFRDCLNQVRGLTRVTDPNEVINQLIELCAQAGVAVVVEKEVKGARINGVIRWLASGNPLIMLSVRHRWADIFWFTFFHEAGHLLLHERRRQTFVDTPQSDTASAVVEAEADSFASQTLIPRAYDNHVRVARTAEDARALAEALGVHAGIVVGRMQHDGVIRFNQLNSLRVRYAFYDDK